MEVNQTMIHNTPTQRRSASRQGPWRLGAFRGQIGSLCAVMVLAALCHAVCLCSTAPAVILGISGDDSTTNITASSLFSYSGTGGGAGGPGDPTAPGFNNVGKSSTGQASVTYLGNGWAITAAHVTISGSVQFNSTSYSVGQTVQVGTSDLELIHLSASSPYPNLPSIGPSLIPSSTPAAATPLIMIGNGLNSGGEKYWVYNGNTSPGTWTASGPTTGPGDFLNGFFNYQGYEADPDGPHTIRWGTNSVQSHADSTMNGTQVFTTAFGLSGGWWGTTTSPFEAQATTGDSGGAVFAQVNGQWLLAGIMLGASYSYLQTGEPDPNPPNDPLFETTTQTEIADLSQYGSQIAAIMAAPEPTSFALALSAASLLVIRAWRRRRR